MQAFTVHKGLVAPMDRANVDTDAIIPKQFLKSIHKTGFGPNLFDEWRYLDHGEPGQDPAVRKPNPDFVLNQPRYRNASVLLARKNFGCGSSREHAPWALLDWGFRAVVAPSFADIFRANALNVGLLPVRLEPAHHAALVATLKESPRTPIAIDLRRRTLSIPWATPWTFPVDPFARRCLLDGVDTIGYALAAEEEIAAFERLHVPAVRTVS